MKTQILLALGLALICMAPAACSKRSAEPQRVSATIVSLAGQDLQVTTEDGDAMSYTLPEGVVVTHSVVISLAEVQKNDFIGCTAVEGPDGKLVAKEIHVLPENMRGAGEGHYPWGDEPNTSMTNGNVEQLEGVADGDGKTLHVSYKGGTSDIVVPDDVIVTRIEPVGLDQLTPGTQVTLFLTKDDAGKMVPRYVSLTAPVAASASAPANP
jgi:hypothetical protein